MQRPTKFVVVGAVAVIAAATGTGIAVASSNDDATDQAITGAALDRASAVALDHTGGGRVTDTEQGDEESFFEVEVTLDDGRQVDVQLDRSFAVVGSEADDDNRDD